MKYYIQYASKIFSAFIILLMSFGIINAQTVHFDDPASPTKATSITDLTVNGDMYDITFEVEQQAVDIYGAYPGTYLFATETDAGVAATAINVELNAASATKIGIVGGNDYESYRIGFEGYLFGPNSVEYCKTAVGRIPSTTWILIASEGAIYNADIRHWAVFTPSTTTGINDKLSGVSVNIFPNPASNYIAIETTANIRSIQLFDHTGKVLIYKEGYQSNLDVSTIDSGMYFLRIEDDKRNVIVQKVVIQ